MDLFLTNMSENPGLETELQGAGLDLPERANILSGWKLLTQLISVL